MCDRDKLGANGETVQSNPDGRRGNERVNDLGLTAGESVGIGAGAMGSAANYAENVVFGGRQGHGYAMESANNLADTLAGKSAELVGRDNAPKGPDRYVDGIQIQSKCWNTGPKCVRDCFEDGQFKYKSADGSPMQIEVPSDLYDSAVKAMKRRIKRGQVDGVSDPAKADEIVRKGQRYICPSLTT